MKTIYAPKWAIDLAKNAKRINSADARGLAMDTFYYQPGISHKIANDMVYSDCNFKESDSFGYGPQWTHAVFNGRDTYSFKSGKLYPIKNFNEGVFECLSESGEWRFCLVEDCSLINGNWTLVNMESE